MARLVADDAGIDFEDLTFFSTIGDLVPSASSREFQLTAVFSDSDTFLGGSVSASLTFTGRNLGDIEADSLDGSEAFITDFPNDARGNRLEIEIDGDTTVVRGLGRVFNDDIEEFLDQDADLTSDFVNALFSRNDTLVGKDGDDTLFGAAGNDVLRGGSGNDRLFGGLLDGGADDTTDGNDRLFGQDGDDFLNGGFGSNRLFGGDDTDVLRVANEGENNNRDVMNGQNGNDWLRGFFGDDILRGGRDDDRVEGGSGDDRIFGNAGNDGETASIQSDALGINESGGLFGGDGDDRIWGNRGEDLLNGGAGNDRLNGGADNDILIGGAGEDILRGGGGDDIFRYLSTDDDTAGNDDTIRGFQVGRDQIDLIALGIIGLDDPDLDISGSRGRTEITISGGPNDITITILGRGENAINDADNFRFAPADIVS